MTQDKSRQKPNARLIAVKALTRIEENQELLESAIERDPEYNSLETRDRAFIRMLVSSYFRSKGQIDQILNGFVDREPPKFVLNALRIGAVQILVLGTADHAAVGETVTLVKNHKKYVKFAGLVNAVLRRTIREGKAAMGAIPPRENIPAWIYKSWERAYGRAAARQMATQLQKTPPLDLTVKSDPQGWAEKLGGEVMFGNTIRLPKAGQLMELAGYDSGDWWVQDLASSLPVQSLGNIEGKLVLDMCAAPGGKTLQLVAGGAEVVALDRSGRRIDILKDNLARTQLSAEIVVADALSWDDERRFDIVLLDAPCSATGTYRRHPDVLYGKTAKQLGQLQRLQASLLEIAVEKLRPGGILVYCTCSLQVEEGEEQMNRFLQKQSDFDLIRFSEEKWCEFGNSGGYLRLLPHHLRENGGLDGFFIAKFSRKTE
ncbi:MAG: RsmB/NOP family class I SAM-dependent RNA methyltransferase [Hellea sp.]|nr:RsmB/NOP family class I SAM-dependent RNA methyltransferase [Hellea sp.]